MNGRSCSPGWSHLPDVNFSNAAEADPRVDIMSSRFEQLASPTEAQPKRSDCAVAESVSSPEAISVWSVSKLGPAVAIKIISVDGLAG